MPLVNCIAVTLVFTLTTLLTVKASGLVPMAPKRAVSAGPGFPVLGFQLALLFQAFAPGVGTFQRKVAAFEVWQAMSAAAKAVSTALARLQRFDEIIEGRH